MTDEYMFAWQRHTVFRLWHRWLAMAHKRCWHWGFPMLLLCEPIFRLSLAAFNAADAEYHRWESLRAA